MKNNTHTNISDNTHLQDENPIQASFHIPKPFERTAMLLGPEFLHYLTTRHITIIGLGAVGFHAAESIVRFGVGNIRIVDFDTIHPSNLNRQLLALHSTIGQPKTEIAKKRLLDINPSLHIETFETFFHEDTFNLIFEKPTDIVIDAIDSFTPKINLLQLLVKNNIPVISSMGAARRTDPTCIKTGDIFESSVCPLAFRIRQVLRKAGISKGITCVYSTETPHKNKWTPSEHEEETYKRGRVRQSVGSISYITGIFGYMIAWEVLKYFEKNQGAFL